MSRRQRRKSGSPTNAKQARSKSKRTKGKGLWWKVLLGGVSLIIVGAIFVYFKAKAFLQSDEFREIVSLKVSDQLGSQGEFGEFDWSGLSGETTGYNAKSDGLLKSVAVEDISVDVDLDFIKRDVFKLKDIKIKKIESSLDFTKAFTPIYREGGEKSFIESLLPEEVELFDAEVFDLSAKIATEGDDYSFDGVSAKIERTKEKNGYDIVAEGGRVKVPLGIVNVAHLKHANIKVRGEDLYLNHAEFSVLGSGKLALNGVVDLAPDSHRLYDVKGKLSNLRCKDVFPDNWQKVLKGEVTADFTVKPHLNELPLITGHLEIKNGTIEALPILNQIAGYLADERYRTIRFQKFECDFEKFGEKITLSNIVLSSKNLLKIEGRIVIDGRKLDGLFDVGLPPEKLSHIPGAETIVFKPGKDRLNWTKVRITGTTDDIKHDLTDRIIEAAGRRLLEQGLEFGGDLLNPENLEKGSDAASKLLETLKGDETLLEGLNGILGGDKGDSSEEKEDKKKKGGLSIPIDPSKIPDLLPFL